ncbi:amino acid permease [Candidatus Bandiella euplotis]|uniref:Amino acid permease n=1 Tax=Candidatus Bandiella euplotis TaxID=1664265 RepID=A0ABZ0UMS1_9RICK|nr:amino acid permease [Candidatus Bandiella woodruffii]WPX97009.1 Putative amino acid permease [Candidatus Bandiella woodruffii]
MSNKNRSLNNLFRKKPIDDLVKEASSSGGLVRNLGAFQLVLLGIGAIIGGGVFVFTGTAAALHAGPAVTLSFALCGFICICAGLCYAEFASMLPVAGSSYTYAYATLGEFPAWLIGCSMVLAYFLAAASVANGWSSYFVGLLEYYDIYLPARWVHVTGEEIQQANGEVTYALFNLPAFLISSITMLVLYRGTRESAVINAIMVTIKMVVLFAFIFVGLTKIDFSNWVPFIPENNGKFGEFGVSGIVSGASILFLAFNGFDSVCTAAQETKNPQKNLPIGIIGAILVSTITYVLVGALLTGVVNYTELNTAQPIAIAAQKMGIPIFTILVKFGAVAAIASVVLVHQYAIIRMLYSMTKDGFLPSVFNKIHKKFHTPYISTVLIGLSMGVISATITLEKMVKMSTFFVLITIAVICFSTVYLRYKQPNLPRKFRCPFVPWVPIAAILAVLQILSSYSSAILLYAAMCLFASTLLYFYMSSRKIDF